MVNQDSKKYGVQIELLKGKGYIFHVANQEKLMSFMDETTQEVDVYNVEQRKDIILFYLLQANEYITIGELAEKLQLSRTPIVEELIRVEEELRKMNLELERKAHYGIRAKGSENDFRKAFSKYVLNSNLYLEPAKNYKDFLETIQEDEFEDMLKSVLAKYNLYITNVAFENIIMHLKILIFRISQGNFITKDNYFAVEIDKDYFNIAKDISCWIKNKYQILLPVDEIHFLSAHISAKTMATTIETQDREKLSREIRNILGQLDQEFLTSFKNDIYLEEALLLHMFPLILRHILKD